MPLIDRAESVLVVIDTQPGFVSHTSRSEAELASATATLERAKWLAAIARLLDVPAVVTEEAPDRNGHTEPLLLERLHENTPVLTKPAFGLAECPHIVEAIRSTKRTTTVLMGFETDVCVSQSAIGLHDLGFRVVVAVDACYSARQSQHEHGLARMAQAGIELVHCKGVAFEWMRTVEQAIATTAAVAELGDPPESL
jgi:nicotinamidase-related amidase